MRNLINGTNHEAINQVLIVAKQDIAIDNAKKAINDLLHTNKVSFEEFGHTYGITDELKNELYEVFRKLSNAKYGKF